MIYVVSEHIGEIGGGAKSPLLLCEALKSIGHEVTLFVPNAPTRKIEKRITDQKIKIKTAALKIGSRWDLPKRVLAFQVYLNAVLRKPTLLFIYSLSSLTRHILRYRLTSPVYAWECTEALAGTEFVDVSISKYLHKVSAVLAPTRTIERNLRATYRYNGQVKILPFWAEEAQVIGAKYHKRIGSFLFMGRLDKDKGLDFLCDALHLVVKHYPSATLTLCGSGDMEWVTEIARHPAIHVCGPVVGDEFENAFRACDALILPSLHEGYPLCLLEACARMKPVIATTVGSIPELFRGSNAALLVPSKSSEALARAMLSLMADSDETYSSRCSDAYKLFCRVSQRSVVARQLSEALDLIAISR